MFKNFKPANKKFFVLLHINSNELTKPSYQDKKNLILKKSQIRKKLSWQLKTMLLGIKKARQYFLDEVL